MQYIKDKNNASNIFILELEILFISFQTIPNTLIVKHDRVQSFVMQTNGTIEIVHQMTNTANQFLLYVISSHLPSRIHRFYILNIYPPTMCLYCQHIPCYKKFFVFYLLTILKRLHVIPYFLQFDSRESLCDIWLIQETNLLHQLLYSIKGKVTNSIRSNGMFSIVHITHTLNVI